MTDTLTFPRETTEFVELTVRVDDQVVTDYEVAVLPHGQRPTAGWSAAAELEDKHGVLVQDLARGLYQVWVRVQSNPETPVISCCLVEVT